MATKFDAIRERLMNDTRVLFEGLDYDVLRTGSQEICLPIVGDDAEEGYLVITFKIPKGSRDGEPYDGYIMADEYTKKCADKAEKAKKAAEAKAKKIAYDKAVREAKAEARRKAKEEKGD